MVGTAVGAWAVPAQAEEVLLRTALAELPVADEQRAGYTRSAFKHWVDADKDGCSTRAEVLLDEAVTPPEVSERCALTGGSWNSYYDDTNVAEAGKLDIDHVVPLAEAWDSGASAWSATRRQEYANDLGDARALVAVTAKSNRAKVDKDPSQWLPPLESVHCRYVGEWIAIKLRWALAIDAAEQASLDEVISGCPNVPITVDRVPSEL